MKRYLLAQFFLLLSLVSFDSYSMKRPRPETQKRQNTSAIKKPKTYSENQNIEASKKLIQRIEQLVMRYSDFELPGSSNFFLECIKSDNHENLLTLLNDNYSSLSGKTYLGKAIICWALNQNYYDIIKLLVNRGIDIKQPKLITNLLLEAIIKGHEDIVQNILKCDNVPVNCVDCFGHNPLIKAIGCRRKNIVKMLLNYSLVDSEINRNMIEVALIWAFSKKQPKIIEKLLYFYKQS